MTERLQDIYKNKEFPVITKRDRAIGVTEPSEPGTDEEAHTSPDNHMTQEKKTPRERAVDARNKAMAEISKVLNSSGDKQESVDEARRIQMIRQKMLKMDERGMQSTQEN